MLHISLMSVFVEEEKYIMGRGGGGREGTGGLWVLAAYYKYINMGGNGL